MKKVGWIIFLLVESACMPISLIAAKTEFTLNSAAFKRGDRLPLKYTKHRENLSPPLSWKHVPRGAGAFALTCIDLDTNVIHWIAYNIPASTTHFDENYSANATIFEQPVRYWGPIHYYPAGRHQYLFTLYALREPVAKVEFELRKFEALSLGKAELIGTFSRDDLVTSN